MGEMQPPKASLPVGFTPRISIEDALAAYRAVIAATTPADNRDQVERARTQITALSAATLDQ